MINFIIKNAIQKAALKLMRDKDLRIKLKHSIKKANELKSEGKLMNTLGKSAGRLKSKLNL